VPNLQQIQGTSNNSSRPATTISSPTLEAIPHMRRGIHWSHHYNWEHRSSNWPHEVSKCCSLHHRWQEYRTPWPLKDVTGDSSHHVDLASKEGSSSNFHDLPPEKKRGFFERHLQGIAHITCWDTGLSKFQTPVRLIQWSPQPHTFVPWTFSNC
jgi:hypothetical protein